MAKAFDATTKHLSEAYPGDWLAYAGVPAGKSIQVVDADLSSFSFAADKLFRVDGPLPYIAHFEFQSAGEVDLDQRVMVYSVIGGYRHKLPVISVVVLLRPEALSPSNKGRVQRIGWPEHRLDFSYKLIRVWEQPAALALAGGLGTLPLAPISAIPPGGLEDVVRQVEKRLDGESPSVAREMEAATYILMGLRYPDAMIRQLLKGARTMKESVTYQAILQEGEAKGEAKGEVKGERNLFIRLATKKFGPPNPNALFTLHAMTDVQRIELLADRLLAATSWEDLLRP